MLVVRSPTIGKKKKVVAVVVLMTSINNVFFITRLFQRTQHPRQRKCLIMVMEHSSEYYVRGLFMEQENEKTSSSRKVLVKSRTNGS